MADDKGPPDSAPKSSKTVAATTEDLRHKAADIIDSVNTQLDSLGESGQMDKIAIAGQKVPGPVGMLFKVIDSVDPDVVQATVEKARRANPNLSDKELAQKLTRDKAIATGAMGATSSLVALVPGVGTLAALGIGVTADLVATFRLQTELVMEIAYLTGHDLSPTERRNAVLAITGLGVGLDALAKRVGTKMAIEVSERYASRAVLKAIPVAGIFASAGVNVLATKIVGDRALAYFTGEPLVPFTEQITQASDAVEFQAQKLWRIAQAQAASLSASATAVTKGKELAPTRPDLGEAKDAAIARAKEFIDATSPKLSAAKDTAAEKAKGAADAAAPHLDRARDAAASLPVVGSAANAVGDKARGLADAAAPRVSDAREAVSTAMQDFVRRWKKEAEEGEPPGSDSEEAQSFASRLVERASQSAQWATRKLRREDDEDDSDDKDDEDSITA